MGKEIDQYSEWLFLNYGLLIFFSLTFLHISGFSQRTLNTKTFFIGSLCIGLIYIFNKAVKNELQKKSVQERNVCVM